MLVLLWHFVVQWNLVIKSSLQQGNFAGLKPLNYFFEFYPDTVEPRYNEVG